MRPVEKHVDLLEGAVVPRKWGNSLGVVLPKEDVDRLHLKEGEPVFVHVSRPFPPALFGVLKGKAKISAQRFKDEARAGWEA